jgi:hypothetical protein
MEYLIGVCVILLVTCAILGYFYVKKDRLPAGRRFVATYGYFTATVIVDKAVPYDKGYFYYADKVISGEELAKSCALGMHVTSWLWDAFEFPKSSNSDSILDACVFVFLDKEAFVTASEAVGHNPDNIAAFAIKYMKDYPYDGPYGCVIRSQEMKNTEIWALVPIHEYVHALTHFYMEDWDSQHKLWAEPYLDEDEKPIATLAAEQTYIILNID